MELMEKKYERLLSYIPYGIENAVSQKVLAETLMCDKSELRAHIQNARKDGIPICSVPGSKNGGYYLSDDPEEVSQCYRMFLSRTRASAEVVRVIRKHLIKLGVNPDSRGGANHE